MFFNRKKRKEKKELKLKQKLETQKAQELGEELKKAEASLEEKKTSLTKEIEEPEVPKKKSSFFSKIKKGLLKTKRALVGGLMELSDDKEIDDDFIEELEEILLAADIGMVTTSKIIEIIERKRSDYEVRSTTEAIEEVKKIIINILSKVEISLPRAETGPTVYLFVGVNGVGKTTSIAKLAARFKKDGDKTLVAAGDTFRAAAIEQLAEWCRRVEVDIVAKEINSDPSATMYEAASKADREQYDVLLCDTSGRLHNKKNLMSELDKMHKVLKKILPDALIVPILVLDANTGQNAIVQTKEFMSLIGVGGLIVTKLDGTAKGGVIIGIVNEFEIPIYFIGVGEGVDDLQPFSSRAFADSLFDN